MGTVQDAIDDRRAYRALLDDPVPDDVVRELANAARLSPSANDTQPWRLVFVRDPATRRQLADRSAFPDYNQWVFRGAMFVAVCGLQGSDASIPVVHRSFAKQGDEQLTSTRPLYLVDLGIAAGFMMLRATELGLVAHPIAGYDEPLTKEILGVPEEYDLVTMLIVGKRSTAAADIDSLPADLQPSERRRPSRLATSEFAFTERFGTPIT